MGNVTIYEIARRAGVSPATVSFVLNNNSRVKPETRKRVQAVIDELQYTPNYIARSFSNKTTGTIGLILPNIENPIFSKMISGVESCISEKNGNLILGISEMNAEKEYLYLNMLREKRVDGLLLFPTYIDKALDYFKDLNAARGDIPVVLCGSSGQQLNDISFVKCDNHKGAFLATEHLISCGRKRIAFIDAVMAESQSVSRKKGYQDALAAHGLPLDKKLMRHCSQNSQDIFQSTMELLEEARPDAIFCLYDYMALIVMRAIYAKKFRIPEDIAVIGYDNIEIGEYLSSSLSSIDTHAKDVGYSATNLLLDKIENRHTENRQIIVQPDLVIRESTAGVI